MEIEESDLCENLKAADGDCIQGNACDPVCNNHGVYGPNCSPADSFHETPQVCRTFAVDSPKWDDVPDAFMKIVENNLCDDFGGTNLKRIRDVACHNEWKDNGVDGAKGSPTNAFYETPAMRISHWSLFFGP